jgi:AcrR family transcriptional regulator
LLDTRLAVEYTAKARFSSGREKLIMVSGRRRGVEGSATRAELIEAGAQLIREEGYAALTSRTLANRLGLSRQIVHYYFKSIDELLIALVEQRATRSLSRLDEAAASAEPLRALWEMCSDPDQAALTLELNALANRRPAVRAVVKKFAEQVRELQTHVLLRHLAKRGISPSIKPLAATVLLTCLSQILALEAEIDIKLGHKETLELVDDCLRAFAEGHPSLIQLSALKAPGSPSRRQGKAAKTSSTGGHSAIGGPDRTMNRTSRGR